MQQHKTFRGFVVALAMAVLFLSGTTAVAEVCQAPDNGSGTVALPAACPYVNEGGTLDIIDGLPPGTEINSSFTVDSFLVFSSGAGGLLGGDEIIFSGAIHL